MISRTMHCDFEGCKATAPILGNWQLGESLYPAGWTMINQHYKPTELYLCGDHRAEGILKLARESNEGFSVR